MPKMWPTISASPEAMPPAGDGARDLAVEVRERGGHLAVARIGDALAVLFEGADAPAARGHQGVPPGGELGFIGHWNAATPLRGPARTPERC